jgi:hypothetical protein
MLSIDQIAAAQDLPTETVAVPEWGGEVKLRTLTATERDAWEAALFSRRDEETGDFDFTNLKSELVARVLSDDSGCPLFADPAGGIQLLAKKSGAVVSRLYEAAQRMNGLTKKDVEELAKNSAAAPSGSSSTTSLGDSAALSPTSSAV